MKNPKITFVGAGGLSFGPTMVNESALTGDPAPALRALIEDPTSPDDEDACRALFDEMLGLQAADLPYGAAA